MRKKLEKHITPFANFASNIKGSFKGVTVVFNSGRHKVVLVVNAGRELLAHYRQGMPTQKAEATKNDPNLLTYNDIDSRKKGSILRPNGLAEIHGARLKFDKNDPSQGIFFIDENGCEYQASFVSQNRPSLLIFKVPADLPKGNCTVTVSNENGIGVFKKDLVLE